MLPANKIANLKRRVNRARRFPDNTCGASRHVHEIAEHLLKYGWDEMENVFEHKHCAESMLSVLESLWKARTELARLKSKYFEKISK